MDALGKRSRDERGGDDGEFHLKECEQGQRNRGSGDAYLRGNVFRVGHVGDADVVKHEEVCGIAYDVPDVVAESEAEPEDHPYDADHAHYDKALKHCRNHVLDPDHAAIEERQARSHHQHEYRGSDHPCHIGEEMIVGHVEYPLTRTHEAADNAQPKHDHEHKQPCEINLFYL